ncbi:MAG: YggS family pyridoxal phosphate-dependent enzyme, partial [Roseiflexaceae bacterium]|nr:YggS family pyridoxal phosphate-dependent enzyme [Roseiflexaceae bacterium]
SGESNAFSPQPSALSPQPSALSPQPSPLTPQPPALTPQPPAVTWHLIGHLQTNKAKRAAGLFSVFHTVDSLKLAAALSRHREGQTAEVLLQVNVSGEASKEGFVLAGWQEQAAVLDQFCAEIEQLLALPALRVVGLMTIAPYGRDPLPTFRATRQLRDTLAARFPSADWSQLSMGMTDDFEAAIAESATMVRVGRAIFGER